MITINANTDNEIVLFLETELDNPYFLFVFSKLQGCDEIVEVLTATDDCGFYLFDVNVDLRSGIYNLAIYEQEDYSNLNPELAHFLKEEKVKIENICDECENVLATSCGDFIITTDDELILIDKDC